MPADQRRLTKDSPQCLKMADVCKLLQLSDRAVYRFMRKGIFPRPVKFGRANRWLASDLEIYLREARP